MHNISIVETNTTQQTNNIATMSFRRPSDIETTMFDGDDVAAASEQRCYDVFARRLHNYIVMMET